LLLVVKQRGLVDSGGEAYVGSGSASLEDAAANEDDGKDNAGDEEYTANDAHRDDPRHCEATREHVNVMSSSDPTT